MTCEFVLFPDHLLAIFVVYALNISLYVSPGNLILQFKGYYFAKILKLRVSAPIIRTRPNWLITT